MTDLASVHFRPGELVAASRRVLENAPTGPAVHGVLAVGPAATATAEATGAFMAWASRVVDHGDELRGYLRGAADHVPDGIVSETIAMIREQDRARVQEAATRLATDLGAAFSEPEAPLREARVLAVLRREQQRVEEIATTVEHRAFELAEQTAVWRGAL